MLAGPIPAEAGKPLGRHSGVVSRVDLAEGLLVLGEVGPWRLEDGRTVVTERTIRVSPSTEFVAVRRDPEGDADGWKGGFVEVPLQPWTVRPGDFVTVVVERHPDRWDAVRVIVATPTGT
jgi:hypothetical protein